MKKLIKSFSARFPVELHQWLKNEASKNNRSMNQELINLMKRQKSQV